MHLHSSLHNTLLEKYTYTYKYTKMNTNTITHTNTDVFHKSISQMHCTAQHCTGQIQVQIGIRIQIHTFTNTQYAKLNSLQCTLYAVCKLNRKKSTRYISQHCTIHWLRLAHKTGAFSAYIHCFILAPRSLEEIILATLSVFIGY